MKKNFLTLFINIILLSIACQAQNITIARSLTPSFGSIGDTFTYQLSVTANIKSANFNPIFNLNPGTFEIKNKSIKKHRNNITYIYKLTIYKIGTATIPTQNFKYRQNQKFKTIKIPALSIRITSLLPQDKSHLSLKPPAPPFQIPFPKSILISIFILILSTILIILIFIYLNKYFKKKNQIAPNTTIQPPYQIALEKLERLKRKKLIEKRYFKIFYIELIDILKEFLAKTYHQNYQEMTTQETLHSISNKLDLQNYRRIQKLLTSADLVKFAKITLSENEHNDNLNRTLKIINIIHQTHSSTNISKEDSQ